MKSGVARNSNTVLVPGRIASLRGEMGISINEAARRSGLGKSGWWAVEMGMTDPRASTLLAIATTLGVHPGDLFPGHRSPVLNTLERRVVAVLREPS